MKKFITIVLILALCSIFSIAYEVKTTPVSYYDTCIAIDTAKFVDSNGRVWKADKELIPNATYLVEFTNRGTPDTDKDDLIVTFELINK